MPGAHVQVVFGGHRMPRGLEAALRRLGATAGFNSFDDVARNGLRSSADAIVVLPPDNTPRHEHNLEAVLNKIAIHPRATLVLQSKRTRGEQVSTPPALPVSYCTKSNASELVARLSTMFAMRPSLDALRRSAASQNEAAEVLANQFHRQLRLAGDVQKQMLPRTLPRIPGVTLHALHRSADYVSGDIYDVRQIDEQHVSLAIVDSEGHGISAAMLSVLIKRALRTGDGKRRNGTARLPRPDRILARLHAELIDTGLTDPQFAAAAYALVNVKTGSVVMARAGAPYPLIRTAAGDVQLAKSAGTLLGLDLDEGSRFELLQFTLKPGDALILHSDGIDPLLRPQSNAAPGVGNLVAAGVSLVRDSYLAPLQAGSLVRDSYLAPSSAGILSCVSIRSQCSRCSPSQTFLVAADEIDCSLTVAVLNWG